MGWADTATTLPIAERAALAAIRADNEDPWAHLALGYVYLFRRRFDNSLAEFELALRLNPNFSLAQGYYGMTLSYCGRWEEGDIAARRALRLSPRDPFSAMYCGIAAYARSSVAITTRQCVLPVTAFGNAAISSAPTACSLPPLASPGQNDVAKAALQELRRAQPSNISLAWIESQMPIKTTPTASTIWKGFAALA